jgi:signal transduction histidine kinase
LQESLSNATRHGHSESIEVDLHGTRRDGRTPGLSLVVRDDGIGFEPAALIQTDGLGLAGIREQAEVLGGSFEVHASPGDGTELRVWWPLRYGASTGG